MDKIDVTIIGSGVVGLAIAAELAGKYDNMIVLDKNDSFGQETSSRNSEVIHAGLYYPKGSLKSLLCIKGNKLLYEYCQKNNIKCKRLGKLLVAADQHQKEKVDRVFNNAKEAGVPGIRYLSVEEIKKMEPAVETIGGFYSPDTGILDTHSFMKNLYVSAKAGGIDFVFSVEVKGIEMDSGSFKISVKEPDGATSVFKSRLVINAAGLWADRIAEMSGLDADKLGYRISFCKGRYFRLKNPAKYGISHLVYPPPEDVSLGIHITPDMGGGIRLGPDAGFVKDINYSVDASAAGLFYDDLKKMLKGLKKDELVPDTSGIRPKIGRDGGKFNDFIIRDEKENGLPGMISLVGIESPGLTSSLAIAAYVKELLSRP